VEIEEEEALTRVTLDTAQRDLATLIEDVAKGGHVLILKDEKPVAQIIPVTKEKAIPKFGSARGMISIREDFDQPLSDFDEYSR
jgi:antitoxin (DNA-binding transcriptional repressor) of toxin-antitoxin stability system